MKKGKEKKRSFEPNSNPSSPGERKNGSSPKRSKTDSSREENLNIENNDPSFMEFSNLDNVVK